MKFLKRLAQLREANTAAQKNNEQLLKQAGKDHEAALAMHDQVVEQAARLSASDRRNHYSESLTHSFRGRTAT